MRKFAILLLSTVVAAGAADAAVTVSMSSIDYGLDAGAIGAADTLITFDEAGGKLANNFQLTIPAGVGQIASGSVDGRYAAPATNASGGRDGTNYLAVYSSSADSSNIAKLLGGQAYTSVSLYWGSIDTYNTLYLLDAAGNATATITAGMIPSSGNGDQGAAATNRRVTIGVGRADAFYGLGIGSTSAAFELDNVKFSGAVPEPASWAMMIGGFGLVGGALRQSKRRSVVAFA